MDIAKVTNIEEFHKVSDAYQELLNDLSKAKASTLKEVRLKLESFINNNLIKLNKAALKDEKKLPELFDFLMLVDEKIPA